LHGDFDAQPAEFATGLNLHVAEVLGIEIARVRIKPIEHAVDGSLDQLRIVRLLDVVGTDALKNVTKQVELPVRVGRGRTRAGSDPGRWLRDQRREPGTDSRTEEYQRRFAHHPRTFSLSLFAHHCDGNLSIPPLETRYLPASRSPLPADVIRSPRRLGVPPLG